MAALIIVSPGLVNTALHSFDKEYSDHVIERTVRTRHAFNNLQQIYFNFLGEIARNFDKGGAAIVNVCGGFANDEEYMFDDGGHLLEMLEMSAVPKGEYSQCNCEECGAVIPLMPITIKYGKRPTIVLNLPFIAHLVTMHEHLIPESLAQIAIAHFTMHTPRIRELNEYTKPELIKLIKTMQDNTTLLERENTETAKVAMSLSQQVKELSDRLEAIIATTNTASTSSGHIANSAATAMPDAMFVSEDSIASDNDEEEYEDDVTTTSDDDGPSAVEEEETE